MANQYAKFEISSFTSYIENLGAKKLNGSRDHNCALFVVICYWPDLIQLTYTQNLTTLALAIPKT